MKIGMLWFDNDPRVDLQTKITRATIYYQSKYGEKPDLCFVHPTMIHERPTRFSGIEVRTTRQVAPNHFWIGIHEGSS